MYDSYIRAIRWASDRIGDEGIVCFVSNGGWIDANSADGLRLSLAEEFAKIYVYNLRGNQRTGGEESRREGGKIFGAGSRNTVAITLLLKAKSHVGPAEIRYHDIGEPAQVAIIWHAGIGELLRGGDAVFLQHHHHQFSFHDRAGE